MDAFKIIEIGLAERDKVKIGLKLPLAGALISTRYELSNKIKKIIARQLNVKSLEVKKAEENSVELDVKITPELEEEGFVREFARHIQSVRKDVGLKKSDLIKLKVSCSEKMGKIIGKNINFLSERTNSSKIEFVDIKLLKNYHEFSIKEEKISVEIL